MRVVAIGSKEMLVGLMLAGIHETLETEDPNEALEFLHLIEKKGVGYLVIIESGIYQKIKQEISQIRDKNQAFIPYEFFGGNLKWRRVKK